MVSANEIKCTSFCALPPLAFPCCRPEASDRLAVSSLSVLCTGQELLGPLAGLIRYVQQSQ